MIEGAEQTAELWHWKSRLEMLHLFAGATASQCVQLQSKNSLWQKESFWDALLTR